MEKKSKVVYIFEKRCRTCSKVLPISRFRRKSSNKDGFACSCKECSHPYNKKHYLENLERNEEYGKKYRSENRKKLNAMSRDLMRQQRLTALTKIVATHGIDLRCMKCGFRDIRALQIDHINGGGTAELKRIGSYRVYQQIMDLPMEKVKTTYQILCANCNFIKLHEKEEKHS